MWSLKDSSLWRAIASPNHSGRAHRETLPKNFPSVARRRTRPTALAPAVASVWSQASPGIRTATGTDARAHGWDSVTVFDHSRCRRRPRLTAMPRASILTTWIVPPLLARCIVVRERRRVGRESARFFQPTRGEPGWVLFFGPAPC